MLRIISVFILCFISLYSVIGQSSENEDWQGTLITQHSEIYAVKAVFSTNTAGVLTGSLTTLDQNGFKLITSVSGNMNKNGTGEIREDKILFISDSSIIDEICYLTYSIDNVIKKRNGTYLSGSYTGKYELGTFCDSGSFIFSQLELSKRKMEKLEVLQNQLEKQFSGKVKFDQNDTLTAQEKAVVPLSNKDFQFSISESGIEDGDSISIEWNQERRNIRLSKQPFSFNGKIKKRELQLLKISAINLGEKPPNTGQLVITAGTDTLKKYFFNLEVNDTTAIQFLRP